MLHDRQLIDGKTKAPSTALAGADAMPSPVISVRGLTLGAQGETHIHDVSFDLLPGELLAFIGRAGGGKSHLLRSLVRMEQLGRNPVVRGQILFNGQNLMDPKADLPEVRRKIALVAHDTSPFPMSIWDNLAYGIKLHRLAKTKADLADRIETALRGVQLWDQVKDQLHKTQGTALAGPQRRQLCIARALALAPEVMLFDRPSSARDRMSFSLVEEVITELRKTQSIVLVARSLENAAHLADRVAFVDQGRIVELDTAEMIFTNALHPETRAFLESSTYL